MKYGEIQYSEVRDLHQPNMVVGRSKTGDWVDRFDEPQATIAEDEVVLEGYDAIAGYAESAFERCEDNGDIQAGLVAVQILHHYRERFGDTTDAIHDDLIGQLLSDRRPSSYKFILAIDAHPAIAAKLESIMRERASRQDSVWAIAHDRHLVAYLEAGSENESLDDSLRRLQQLRSE